MLLCHMLVHIWLIARAIAAHRAPIRTFTSMFSFMDLQKQSKEKAKHGSFLLLWQNLNFSTTRSYNSQPNRQQQKQQQW